MGAGWRAENRVPQAGCVQQGRAAQERRRVRSGPEGSQGGHGPRTHPRAELGPFSCPWEPARTQGRRAEQSELVCEALIFIQQNTSAENIYGKCVMKDICSTDMP